MVAGILAARLGVEKAVGLTESVTVGEGDELPLGVELIVGVFDGVGDAGAPGDPVCVPLPELEVVAALLPLIVCVALPVGVPLKVRDPLEDPLEVPLGEGVMLGVGVREALQSSNRILLLS